MSDDFFQELQDGFLQEARDLLSKVEALSLQLERAPGSTSTFEELARLAHNFKGSGKAVGFDHISKLGHRLEDFILAIKGGVVSSSPTQLDFLFKCLDILKTDIDTLISDKNAVLEHSAIFREIDARIAAGPDAELKVSGDAQVGTSSAVEPLTPANGGAVQAGATPTAAKTQQPEVLRVQKGKIDFLLEAFGEQVILQSTLEQCKFDLEGNKELLIKTISQLTKLTFELQGHALALTMVQLGPVYTKLERAARDAGRMCGKRIEVVMTGVETEVDKTLIDSLSDSLTHMVRNAVDHAIEDPMARLAAGKSEAGTVRVSTRRAGGQLWIEVADDGKGLDPQLLRAKALAKGLITTEAAARMSPEESYHLIFANGFSTKEAVSEVSGRGVGMNVVNEAVAGLKGAIEIESAVGIGTCFRLKLPLSLAIFNGAVVKVSEHRFVVPSSEIAEIGRIRLEDRVQLENRSMAIKIRDEVFELIDLRRRLGSTSVDERSRREFPVLISRKSGKRAYLVDEILGIQKIVQKPLGDEVKRRPEFVAGTILGDGSPGVILNLHFLGGAA